MTNSPNERYIPDEELEKLKQKVEYERAMGHDGPCFCADLLSLIHEVQGSRSFKRSVDYALNSGDGSYRP